MEMTFGRRASGPVALLVAAALLCAGGAYFAGSIQTLGYEQRHVTFTGLASGAGITVKTLHVDRETGRTSLLMRMEPGSRYASHGHTGDGECLMLSGEVSFGDLTLRAGDYYLAPKGMVHAEAHSATGALVFIRAHTA